MNPTARAIVAKLSSGPATAAELMGSLGVSQPMISRAMQALQRDGLALCMGAARSTRYALRRAVPGVGSQWPLFKVDEQGSVSRIGQLHSLAPHHYFLDTDIKALQGLTDHMPYFLQDQRPAGFLGRGVPSASPDLGLPARVMDWTTDHYLTWLVLRAPDTPGDLIAGDESLNRHLLSLSQRRAVRAADRAKRYPTLADAAMAGTLAGSSAHGEHPKFTTVLEQRGSRVHVIVKFSPPRTSQVGQRWADLLIAEHLAHEHLCAHGIAACRSAIFEFGERTFLEVERFDRVGEQGRRGLVSLLAVDAARYGRLDRWASCASRLAADKLITAGDAERIQLLDAFGQLIANTDRHFGNLSLFDRYDGRFALAPNYDMLPMLFAPSSEQLVERSFEAPHPTAETLAVWPQALQLAKGYWERVSGEKRISAGFRRIVGRAMKVLE